MDKLKYLKNLKKSDWAVIGLVGALLLVIAMPMDTAKKEESSVRLQSAEAESAKSGNASTRNREADLGEAYVDYLEEKLEEVLQKMEGVGNVKVMITVSDAGESVVEKDKVSESTVTTENDSAGGSRSTSETSVQEETIYTKKGEETYPYIQKERLPAIEGVVVVAEGGDNSHVAANISESIKALLPVEVHRIKVVKMCSGEE